MKNMPMLPKKRNRELGAVAIVVAFTWTALFGVAVLAIDFGYLYAKRRGLQTAADGLLKLSMPDWAGQYPAGLSQATQDATNSANVAAFGVSASEVTTSQDVANKLFTVKVSRTYPTFIGGLFGMNGKTVSASATGQKTGSGGGAVIQALSGAVCPGGGLGPVTWGAGFFAQGNITTVLTINGTVESGTQVFLQPGTGTISGDLKTDCPTPLNGTWNPAGVTVAGIQSTVASGGGVIIDSIAVTPAMINAAGVCTQGNILLPGVIPPTWTYDAVNNCDTPADGVYCSSSGFAVNPQTSLSICAGSRATFLSQGQITFGASTAIGLRPSAFATGPARNLIAASWGALGAANCGTADVFFGSSGTFTLGDATNDAWVYAPNGCIELGGGGTGGLSLYGKMVGKNVDFQMSPGPPWVLNGGGGGGPSAWKRYK